MATLLKVIRGGQAVVEKAVEPENGSDFSLKELQTMVGGCIEIVNLPSGKIMVVNEEGRLIGLPINSIATELYGGLIVGNALVCNKNQVL